ncbi:MAG TPA: histidine--tRNA ligase [Longimicrobiales bacterium]|nr:histidine--tRNA ligase [Longimicrobiales bacterium]
MPSFTALPGFRDFYPAEFAIRAHILNAWRETARRYGYEEYDGPPLEPLELYVEKSGEEIVRQLYNFEDKGGRSVALRPEMTPTFARMVGARAAGLRKPIRWFSMPQLFRYERTQRGRLREHFQLNVDIVGETDVGADAEVLAVALDALRLLGLTADDVVARVNDRRLLEAIFFSLGVAPAQLLTVYGVIDKIGRESAPQGKARLRDAGLSDDASAAVFALAEAESLSSLAGTYGERADVIQHTDRLQNYLTALAQLGLGDFVRFDPTIVRGLAYYTGIVFEIFDRKGELRAICGGGRYDGLLRTVSDTDLPAAGFGMGDVVLGELLRERGLLPSQAGRLDYYIVTVSEHERSWQRRIAQALRARGKSVSYGFATAGVGKQFKDADARGARTAIVLGPDEIEAGEAVIRDMRQGVERRVKLEELMGGGAE